jgi:hypothetical protein
MPRRINVTSRGLRTEFEQSITGDIVRALVEIVTNADDSYKRAGKDGPIYIEFGKLRKNIYPVSVTDNAEGMSEKNMSRAADVGVETSGFASKKTIRGLLGRGLKQAAFGIGVGVAIEAIKGGVLSAARLYLGGHDCMFATGSEFSELGDEDQPPHKPTAEERERLRIPGEGTRITLHVSKDLWTVNKHQDTILERLQTHYALRSILKNSSKRPIHVIDRDGSTYGPLTYKNPKTDPDKPVLSTTLDIDGFPAASPHLRIYRSAIELGPVEEYSESGVIVYANDVPLVQTFFGRESHPLAGRFYGRLKCDYIADLLKKENAAGAIKLISLQRQGFTPNHPFTKALTKAAQPQIDKLLQQESEREKKQDSEKADKSLQKALDSLVPELNKLLSSLLNPIPDSIGPIKPPPIDPSPPVPYYQPLQDLEFFPEEIGVRAHADKQTTLYVRDGAFTDKEKLKITVEGEGIRVVTADLQINHARASNRPEDGPVGYSKVPFKVAGIQAGTNAIVYVSAGKAEAMLLVTVGSYKEPPPPTPKPKGTILKEISINDFPGKYRAHFDAVTGTLKVNTAHPLQKHYAVLRGEKDRVKRRPWVTAVADAMTDALFRVIISNMIEEKGTIPRDGGSSTWNKTMVELDSLWYSLGTGVHKVVESKLLNA